MLSLCMGLEDDVIYLAKMLQQLLLIGSLLLVNGGEQMAAVEPLLCRHLCGGTRIRKV